MAKLSMTYPYNRISSNHKNKCVGILNHTKYSGGNTYNKADLVDFCYF